MPSCQISKDLLSSLEEYLKVKMPGKFGKVLGDEKEYEISIKESIGTETLSSIDEYTPSLFADGIENIHINWENGYRADHRLKIDIRLHKECYLSTIKIDCVAPTAREVATGIGEAIFRILNSHRTYNWIFNPFEMPIIGIFAGITAIGLLSLGMTTMVTSTNDKQGLYVLSGAALSAYVYFSSKYFKPFISFNTRRQRLLDTAWKYFSLGTFGFIIWGTLVPLIRNSFLGF